MIAIKHRFTAQTLCEFPGDSLRGADLRRANLDGANLDGADLYGADLRGANLDGANLRGANLYGADLRGANLYGADLRGANLYGANLYGADLRGANLYGANLRGADLYGANLDGEVLKQGPIVVPCGLTYRVLISDGFMRIGCQRHTHSEWAAFDDKRVLEMDGRTALTFWRTWRGPLLAMCDAHAKASNNA